jgi:hypothetical protein
VSRPLYWRETPGGGVEPSDTYPRSPVHLGDEIAGGYRVSTVFLGLDHSHDMTGPPVLYETMVFGTGEHDQWCERYCTRAEAADGHARVVAALSRGEAP